MKFVEAEEIKTNKLIVGSETQPTGITVYDKNGKPGCVSVDDVDSGQFKLAAGICNIQPLSGNQGVVDIVQGIETFAETATTTDAATSGAAASTETATTTPAEGGEPVASTTAKTTSTSEPTQPVVPQESSSPETPSSTNAQ